MPRNAAGARDIGYLYNFRHGGRIYCYQIGAATFADAWLEPDWSGMPWPSSITGRRADVATIFWPGRRATRQSWRRPAGRS
jgi:hypothetical protein